MRKQRIKALKATVLKLTGKPLPGIQIVEVKGEAIGYIPSMRRRVKKAHNAMRRDGVLHG